MPATPKSADMTGHLLRSSAQIARVLDSLVSRRENVTVELPGNLNRFTGRIMHADLSGQFIIVTATDDESLNAALLARVRVTFVSQPGEWHVEFVAVEPSGITHEGAPAIRLRYPEILTVQQRRQFPRHEIPPVVPLRCVADAGGFTPFDAEIKDISLGGMSVLFYAPDIMLEPGTVLVGSRINAPGAGSITVDLEVRYSKVVTLPDGSPARYSGFLFVNAGDDLKNLVDTFDMR
ncbi:MAG: hypothetical protein A3H35_08465 [Betaproteobacteria bacterium RIFCSPLOWO2_02_FULL_62_17]|nr:MAG: hypothetical protein A3H35_08465 [Betaproteobacteria bacterium RIFCSPLOWO2_02_FULL_62_17]